MEQLDILDENGQPTGEVKDKDAAHRDGSWHRSVHVWFVNDRGELLIQKRAATKENHPNMWDIPSAGHCSAGEHSIKAALRETKEELGLAISPEQLELLGTIKQMSVSNGGAYVNNEIDDVYLVTMEVDPTSLVLQVEEVAEVKTIPFEDLEKLTTAGDPTVVAHPQEYKLLFTTLHSRFS